MLLCLIYYVFMIFLAQFIHITLYTYICFDIASFTSFHHHVYPLLLLPLIIQHTSSYAIKNQSLKCHHKFGMTSSTNSIIFIQIVSRSPSLSEKPSFLCWYGSLSLLSLLSSYLYPLLIWVSCTTYLYPLLIWVSCTTFLTFFLSLPLIHDETPYGLPSHSDNNNDRSTQSQFLSRFLPFRMTLSSLTPCIWHT